MTSYHGQMLRNILYYHNMQYEIHQRPQTQEIGQNAFSWIINELEFSRKNGRVRFFPLAYWTYVPSFAKILRAVFHENCWLTDQLTNHPTIPAGAQLTLRTTNYCSALTRILNVSQQPHRALRESKAHRALRERAKRTERSECRERSEQAEHKFMLIVNQKPNIPCRNDEKMYW